MKKKNLIITMVTSLILSGCSAPTTADSSDNSAELESLKAQVESLQNENSSLKSQAETTVSPEENTETSTGNAADSFSVGENVSLKDWNITVTNVQITDAVSENQYVSFKPENENKYLVVDMTVTNNGKNAASFLPSFGFGDDISAKILYQNEYEFSSTNLLGYSKELHDTTVNPLSTKNGSVAFEIPNSIADSDEELILVIQSGNDTVNIKVR